MRALLKALAVVSFLVGSTVSIFPNTPPLRSLPLWINTYGTAGFEVVHSLRRATDGGFFLCGSKGPTGGACDDSPWVLRLDASGAVLWSKSFPFFTGGGTLMSVRPTSDGGCVAAGYTGCSPYLYWWVVKLDSSGNVTGETQMNMSGFNTPVTIELAPDGGYLVLSDFKPMVQTNVQIQLTKLDSNCSIVWSKVYGNAEDHRAGQLAAVTNGYLVAGWRSKPSPSYEEDAFLMRIDLLGNITWEKYYGGAADDAFQALSANADGSCMVSGVTFSFSGGLPEVWILKVNSTGTPIWQKSLVNPDEASARSILIAPDGGAFVQAFVPYPGFQAGLTDNDWLLRFDSSGGLVWQKYITLSSGERSEGLASTYDGGLVCPVSTTLFGSGDTDAAILKFSDQGNLGGTCPPFTDPGIPLRTTSATIQGALLTAQAYTATPATPPASTQNYPVTQVSVCSSTLPCQVACTASANVTQGTAPLAVSFSTSVTLTYCQASTAYSWDFGDGATSSQKNPSHTYTAPGAYTWVMTASAEGSICSRSGTVTVTSACTVDCAATAPTTATVGIPVTFSLQAIPNGCAGSLTFHWSFGDGSTSSEQSPSHTYAAVGTYAWSASATVEGIVCQRSGTLHVIPACNLACTAEAPTTGTTRIPLDFTLQFTATDCLGSPSFSWIFGDGGTSDAQNPTHTYAAAGLYTWEATVTADGTPCSKTGMVTVVDPCTMTCIALATPTSGPAPLLVHFSSTVTTTGQCGGTPIYAWTFGDGSTSQEQSPTHTYEAQGTYPWTFTATLNGQICSETGTVIVSGAPEGFWGDVGILADVAFFALNGPDVSGTAILTGTDGHEIARAALQAGAFSLGTVPPGSYLLRVDLAYTDRIVYDASLLDFGCAAPPQGAVTKTLSSKPQPVTVQGPVTTARVTFPPPLVFLHGALECYMWWYEGDPGVPDQDLYWDNAARDAGFISFTPNYAWYGSNFSWPTAANQVSDQIVADLQGLHLSNLRSTLPVFVPWTLVAHDMGGLVARVLAQESQGIPSFFSPVRTIFSLGTPNSGSDMLLGGGDNSLLSVNSLLRRFNEVYPDFGEFTDRVVALAGDQDWWNTAAADGPLTIQSALSITRLACSQGASANCTPYAHHTFRGGASQVFSFDHYALGGPESAEEILRAFILDHSRKWSGHDPESPAGSTIWGTGARTTGNASGSVQTLEAAGNFVFSIGPTDGMAIGAWVTGGSATFQVLNPSGEPALGAPYDSPGFIFTRLNPEAGGWILRVLPGPGGATFSAAAVENSPFGIEGYLGRPAYFPGETAALRADMNGSQGGVTPGPCTATLVDLSGSPLQTVQLDPSGGHFTGVLTVPASPGSYPVTITLTGSYYGTPFVRTAYERLNVVPSPTRGSSGVFTGVFADRPQDRDGDGKYDTITLDVQVHLESPGQYAFAAEIYDASGNWIAHGIAHRGVQAQTTLDAPISFSLAGIACVQFTGPFAVRNLVALDGASLVPISLWATDIATQSYDSGSFQCSAGVARPALHAVLPDEGVRGRNLDLVISGTNFREGATVFFGSGIAVNGSTLLSENALEVSVSVLPDAAPGFRDLSFSNPGDAESVTLAHAFEVNALSSPRAALLSPGSGSTLEGAVLVSASAVSDLPVIRVEYQLDGRPLASDAEFPYQVEWDTTRVSNGSHTISAICVDDTGQASPPSSVTVTVSNSVIPGDCDRDGAVSIGEVQKAINMFLGIATPDCGVDCNGNGSVSIGEIQKVINGFLEISTSC